MTIEARVLMLGRDGDWPDRLGPELDRLGWRTIHARETGAALACVRDLAIEAVLVDGASGLADPAVYAALRNAAAPRKLLLIHMSHVRDHDLPDPCDMVFGEDAHPSQLVLCFEHMVRANIAEEEYELRLQTLKAQNIPPPEPAPDRPLAILSVGSPAPDFLALSHHLRARGADVLAAFSSYSAFDYLHERAFDAVVLWATESLSEPLSVATGMRRNTRLYHLPVFLHLQQTVEPDPEEVWQRGVNDMAGPGTPEADIAARVIRLARSYRRQTNTRRALEEIRYNPRMDVDTGLFTRELFAAHLARLSAAAAERNRPLSVCVLRIAETPDITRARQSGKLRHALSQIGSMIGRLVRAEDTAGRLSAEMFALALPATRQWQARLVGERIAAVIGCTAFETGGSETPFVVGFEIGTAELQPHEPAAEALLRAGRTLSPAHADPEVNAP